MRWLHLSLQKQTILKENDELNTKKHAHTRTRAHTHTHTHTLTHSLIIDIGRVYNEDRIYLLLLFSSYFSLFSMFVGLRHVDNWFACILSPPSLHPFPFFTAGPQRTVAVLHVTGVRKVWKQVLLFCGRWRGVGDDSRIQNHQRLYRMHWCGLVDLGAQ